MALENGLTFETIEMSGAGALAGRWEAAAATVRNTPLCEMDIGCLARYCGVRLWVRNRSLDKETLASYVYMGYGELLDASGLSLRQIEQLVEIVETSLDFDEQCEAIVSDQAIEQEALRQRMRVVRELGLFLDYPVRLSNLDHFSREYCAQAGLDTLDALILYINREHAVSGSLKSVQGMLAHGDRRGLAELFPYRVGWWGFHLPEALKLCLGRLTAIERRAVENFYDYCMRDREPGTPRLAMPPVLQRTLLPEVFECIVYFGRKQPALVERVYRRDFGYLNRRLMHLDDPELEARLMWLVKLATNVLERTLRCASDPQLDPPCVRFPRDMVDGFLMAVEHASVAG